MDWMVWGPPLGVLGVAMISGLIMAWFGGRNASPQHETGDKADILAARQLVMEKIRELDADQSKMEPTAYQQERDSLINQAANLLKEEEQGKEAPRLIPSKDSSYQSVLRIALYLGGSTVFFGLLGVTLSEYLSPAPLEQTRDTDAAARQSRLTDAKETLETDPENLDALNTLAYDAMLFGEVQQAMSYLEPARKSAPENPDVLVHLGVLQLMVGMTDRAQESFEKALVQQPEMSKAFLWRAVLNMRLQKKEAALKDLERAQAGDMLPEERHFAKSVHRELTAIPVSIMGSVSLAEGIEPPANASLFVVARRAKEGGGPPVAARKIANPKFPVSFQLSRRDMVMGGDWPEQVWLDAKLDQDGSAMTTEDGNLATERQGPIEREASGVNLTFSASSVQRVATAPESSSSGSITGTISLSAGVEPPSNATLFVVARRAKEGGGPPVAALKVSQPQFPVSFSIGVQDMMLGGEWPAQVWLDAKLDQDGNAMTKSAGDLATDRQGPLGKGQTGVSLVFSGMGVE